MAALYLMSLSRRRGLLFRRGSAKISRRHRARRPGSLIRRAGLSPVSRWQAAPSAPLAGFSRLFVPRKGRASRHDVAYLRARGFGRAPWAAPFQPLRWSAGSQPIGSFQRAAARRSTE